MPQSVIKKNETTSGDETRDRHDFGVIKRRKAEIHKKSSSRGDRSSLSRRIDVFKCEMKVRVNYLRFRFFLFPGVD